MGLNNDYGNIRGNILMMKLLPNISQAYAVLIQDEKQKEVKAATNLIPESASMYASNRSSMTHPQENNSQNFSDQKGKFEGKKNIVCNHCKKPGHTSNKCYRLVGFPTDFKFTKGRKIAGNVGVDFSNQQGYDYQQKGNGLSQGQYNQLLQLLNNNQQQGKTNIPTGTAPGNQQFQFFAGPSMKSPLVLGRISAGLYLLDTRTPPKSDPSHNVNLPSYQTSIFNSNKCHNVCNVVDNNLSCKL